MIWLPASTFGTSVPYKQDTTELYSIFAKWKFEGIPGMDRMMVKFKENVSPVENVGNELSPSNIAMLSLPLVMALIPISLFQEVSTAATALYVLLRDVLVAVPLLIKGIELVIVSRNTKATMYPTLSIMGQKYGVYERWSTQCHPPVGITQTAGTIIISIALWLTTARSYAEFAFWRRLQYQRGRLDRFDEIPSDAIDEESEEVNENSPPDSEEMNTSWFASHRYQVLAGVFLHCVTALFISEIATRLIAAQTKFLPLPEFSRGVLLFPATVATKYVIKVGLVCSRIVATDRFSKHFLKCFVVG